MKNLANPAVIKEILIKNGFNFSKSLGQNFLIDENALDEIISGSCPEGANVLEIGPGFGTLTQRLCRYAKKVVCVEIDSAAIPILTDNLSDFDNLSIIHADIMKTDIEALSKEYFDGERIKVCANLPYYITSPVIMSLLNPALPIDDITVMIQKEVAERINASPGSKDYGVLTLTVGYYATCSLVTVVEPSSFMPPPKVDSAVICLTMRDKPAVEVKSEEMYFRVIKAAFALRRKTLLNALSSGLGMPKDKILKALSGCGIDEKRRGETLSDVEFACLSDYLTEEAQI